MGEPAPETNPAPRGATRRHARIRDANRRGQWEAV